MSERSRGAADIATAVTQRQLKAGDVVATALADIAARNASVSAFTNVTADRAIAAAARFDAEATGRATSLPLAGVPFAVKNLFDVAGLPTRAGSRINRSAPPATTDAVAIRRLEAAGAVLVGALNMGEYAYDFTGENVHDGASRNPHDPACMSGGSSGGSAAAVAAGLVPIALGSDTNGSIRVPASLCGIFGLKPTFGRLPRTGTFPFVSSLDHIGPFARSSGDLALAYDALQGPDLEDPVCSGRPIEPVTPLLDAPVSDVKVAVAGGYFARGLGPEAQAAMQRVTSALGARASIELPEVARARAAAFLITASEGAALHLDRLRTHAAAFDPATRDRLIAGAMVPAAAVIKAQKLRRWFRDRVLRLFDEVDVIVAPATPCTAPRLGQQTFHIDGRELPVRPNLGLYTQPISFIGLPVVAVPVPLDPMPIGVQIITAPWREDLALRIARRLEQQGVISAK